MIIDKSIEPKEEGVAHISEVGNPSQVGGDAVKNIPVGNKKFLSAAFINHISLNGKISDLKREYLIQKVIMITAEVVDLGVVFFNHFEHSVKKTGVLPLPGAGLSQLPAVDDVSVEDEVFTSILLEKPCHLFGL
jgi:hypothetical protein